MTAPTNIVATTNSIGNREDLENVIYRVAAETTPFISNIGKGKATAILHEWQTETLANPDATNCQLEGDDVGTVNAGNLTTRVGNYCQITTKSFAVTRTQEIVDKAGRASEINRQKVLKGLEGRRDIEMRFMGNYASNAEVTTTPRRAGGAQAWLTSNVSRGVGGSSGGFATGVVAAATNGTQRTFAESQVKTVQASCFGNGGRPTQAYVGPTHKQQFSTFTGIGSIRKDAPGDSMATIIGAADVYVGDFGKLALIPHPYALTRACVLIDPTMFAYAPLDGWKNKQLSDTGDSTKYLMTTEVTLICRNEKASGIVADLT